MARAAKKVPVKAQKGRAPTKSGAGRTSAPAKASGNRQRDRAPDGDQTWFGALDTLARSPLGREILADVLEAAAATIRNRPQVISNAIDAGMQTAANAAETTADAVQKAASALADMTSRLIPSSNAAPNDRGGKRKAAGRSAAKKRRA
jgi:hypothetical protein